MPSNAPRRAQPRWTAPMLAVLTEERFSSGEWIFERKLDGERCLAFRRGAEVRLLSRTQKRLNGTYPELADALLAQACEDFVVDGEVVAFEGARLGRSVHDARSPSRGVRLAWGAPLLSSSSLADEKPRSD